MLIREDLAIELAIASRVLAHAGALPAGRRVSARASEVVYLAGRGVESARMTPYDVVAVRVGDGEVLRGDPPENVASYLEAYRRDPDARSVAADEGGFVSAASLTECARSVLARARPDLGSGAEAWERALGEARAAGALIGVEP